MAKVTSKYQVTVPRKIAEAFHIHPGDDIEWVASGEVIRVVPSGKRVEIDNRESRLRLFDKATERIRRRPSAQQTQPLRDRGWRREDLYTRGRTHRYERSGLPV